jgi:hypothetical protein
MEAEESFQGAGDPGVCSTGDPHDQYATPSSVLTTCGVVRNFRRLSGRAQRQPYGPSTLDTNLRRPPGGQNHAARSRKNRG